MFVMSIIIAFYVACVHGYSTRIVNGSRAELGAFPYIVSIQLLDQHNCGGSILDETHILTAAHCVDGFEQFNLSIQYGVIDLAESKNKIPVSGRVYHAGFSKSHGFFDIAILTLAEPIKFDDNAQPATLAEEWALTPEGHSSVLVGWGLGQTGGSVSRYLEKADLHIFNDEVCEETYNTGYQVNSEMQICSGVEEGGKGQCSGDSGGPLYADGVQVGVVSWSLKPCAGKGLPGVYTKVSMYRRWISKQIRDGNN